MNNRKNEKGFALVLSLVLLMAMSLMGGALIVISASDHQSNNVSDEYQQTFYVAETALYEGEKYLLNQFLGPYKTDGKRDLTKRNLPANSTSLFRGDMTRKNYIASDQFYFDTKKSCFASFKDLDRTSIKVVAAESWNFGDLIRDSFNSASTEERHEAERLKGYYYEYFITRIGAAPFRGYGSSIKKEATDTGNDGMAYRIYGCGIKALGHGYNKSRNQHNVSGSETMIVALESTIVLPK